MTKMLAYHKPCDLGGTRFHCAGVGEVRDLACSGSFEDLQNRSIPAGLFDAAFILCKQGDFQCML